MKFKDFVNSRLFGKTNEALWERNEDDDDEGGWGEKGKKKIGKEDKEKEVKKFNVGDIIILTDTKKSSKIPADAWDFLMTYKIFTVRKVNEKGKIDIGCHISKNTPEGGVEKIYMFSPERFKLETPSPVPPAGIAGTEGEELNIDPNEEANEQAPETSDDSVEV